MTSHRKQLIAGLICFAVALVIYIMPVPEGVDPRGMHMLGIFVGTILALILQPLPTASVAIIGITLAMLTGTMSASKEALVSLGSSSIWIIVSAFFIAQGFVKTGLGRRIALMLLSTKLGNSALGISYSLAATDFVLSPATPSNTARLGGTLFPIIKSISELQGSTPDTDENRHKLGSYLCLTANTVNSITSGIFLTAMAGGPVVARLASEAGVELGWGTWALANILPGLIALIVLPRILLAVFPPTLRQMPGGAARSKQDLQKLGPISKQERIMLITFVVMMVLWILGSSIQLNATATAFLGVSVLLITGVLEWADLAGNKSAWQTLIYFGVLVGMATQLQSLKVIAWLGNLISSFVGGFPWHVAFAILIVLYILVHYLFASQLAQVVALYALFLTVSISLGVPQLLAAMSLGVLSAIVGSMTHYACGPAALVYGSGYLTTAEFIKYGFISVVVTAIIWLAVGLPWWHVIGLY